MGLSMRPVKVSKKFEMDLRKTGKEIGLSLLRAVLDGWGRQLLDCLAF